MKIAGYLSDFLEWRKQKISDRQFILFLSVIIGLAVGFAAVIIKNLVHLIQSFCEGFANQYGTTLFIVYPSIGILITVLFVKYINKNPVRHGIPSVLFSISKNNGVIKRHNLYSSIITSALTVGFGGSVGLEGPTVATGAAIGSNIGQLFKLDYKQIVLLLGCASAGAMAAIFKAPITAIVFALEVIMLDLTMAAIVPLLISSATAALTSYFFMGQNYLYSFEIKEHFILSDTPFYILFGVFCGLISLYFTRVYKFLTGWFERIDNYMRRLIIGGIFLGILIFFIPSLYGEGYEVINKSLHGNFSFLFESTLYENYQGSILAVLIIISLIVLTKAFATTITFGSGGVGGIFAPTLFLGANTGLLFSKVLETIGFSLSESNFALAGMAGLISGVIHAPLTAIFLIAEITGGYNLFMPLMIVATISFATIRIFETNSVYTFQLAKRGELMTHHKDKAVLMRLNLKELIETDFHTIHPDATLGDLVQVVSKSHRNIFPVVDKDGIFKGIVKLDSIRDIMFRPEQYDIVYVKDIMFMPDHIIDPRDLMEDVARKFQESGRFNIAVIENGKYLGFISRAKLFSSYRKMLSEFSEH